MKSLFITAIVVALNFGCDALAQESLNTDDLSAKNINIPFLEDYDIKKEPNKYFDLVYEFIAENPESKFIPRICYDFYLAALESSNGDLIKKGKALLLIEGYPSVYSRQYLSSIPDASGIRALIEDVTDVIDSSDKDKVEPLCNLIRFGYQKFKGEVMGDTIEFPILMFLLASLVGDEELRELCSRLINSYVEKDNSNLPVSQILFSKKTPYEKYSSLTRLNTSLGRYTANLYYDYLTEAEQTEPAIIISRLGKHYKSQQFEEILKDIKDLPDDNKGASNIVTLKAMALFALNEDVKAIETLKKAMGLAASTEQKTIIKDYASYVDNFDENKKSLGELLPKFSNTFLGGELTLEVDLSLLDPNRGSKSNVYIAINLTENYVELHVLNDQELIIAFQVKDDNTRLYINPEESISVYDGTAVYPVPSITLNRHNDGGFNFLMGFQLSTNISSLSSSSFKLFGSPYLSTVHGVHEIYDYTARLTSFQIAPSVFDGVNYKIKFSTFDWYDLKINSMDLVLNKDYEITRIDNLNDANGININRFYLGSNKKHVFLPPAWPDKPIEKKGKFDAKQFMVLFGQIINTIGESISK